MSTDESESERSSDNKAKQSESEESSNYESESESEEASNHRTKQSKDSESEEMSKEKKVKQLESEEESSNDDESEQSESSESESESEEKPKGMLTVKMEFIEEDSEEKVGPVVGYFPSAYNPLDKERHPKPPRIKLYRSVERPRRMQVVIEPKDERVKFVGTNYKGEAELAQHVSYGVGVLDRKNRTLKIVPIAGDKIFRLEPRPELEVIHDKEPEEEEQHTPEKKYEHAQQQLADHFGTKVTVNMNKHMKQLYQSKDIGLATEVADDVMNKLTLETGESGISGNIPPHNLLADTPEKAYPLNKIILKGEWVYLKDIWELLQSNEQVKADIYPSFVCNRVYKLDLIQDVAEKKRQAGILSYITHLIKFRDKYSMDGAPSAKYHEFPRILSQRLRTLFFDAEKKRLSDGKQGLLTSYILILTLHFDEFKTDPTDIAKDLRTNYAILRKDYEKLGCKLTRENNVTLATLPVPLNFNFSRKRKR
ncbi:DNA-directed RNA polymerase I subunit RPA49-like protein [Drosera capensis]